MPTLTAISQLEEQLEQAIHREIRKRIEELISRELVDVVERVEQEVRASIGAIASKVLRKCSFERFGSDLVIKVEFAFAEPIPPVMECTANKPDPVRSKTWD